MDTCVLDDRWSLPVGGRSSKSSLLDGGYVTYLGCVGKRMTSVTASVNQGN
jgi:hypothetical protein